MYFFSKAYWEKYFFKRPYNFLTIYHLILGIICSSFSDYICSYVLFLYYSLLKSLLWFLCCGSLKDVSARPEVDFDTFI